jgi:hypothetical protein
MAPAQQKQWTVESRTGFDALKFNEKAPVPELGDKDVLVRCKCNWDSCYRYSQL